MGDWVVDNNGKTYVSSFNVNRPPRPRKARAPLLIEGGACFVKTEFGDLQFFHMLCLAQGLLGAL